MELLHTRIQFNSLIHVSLLLLLLLLLLNLYKACRRTAIVRNEVEPCTAVAGSRHINSSSRKLLFVEIDNNDWKIITYKTQELESIYAIAERLTG